MQFNIAMSCLEREEKQSLSREPSPVIFLAGVPQYSYLANLKILKTWSEKEVRHKFVTPR